MIRSRMYRRLLIAGLGMALLATGLVTGVSHAGNFVAEAGSDFDCDGVRDLVVAVQGDDVDGAAAAGSVTVTFGGTGFVQRITQETPGVPGASEADDRFGQTYAVYDRNADGCDDLVIGVPGEDLGSIRDAGMVVFIPGSSAGALATMQSVSYTQDSAGFAGAPERGDEFGGSLGAGRTHAGTPFLLIGAPFESHGRIQKSGVVYYVRPNGVAVIDQDTPGVISTPESHDYFGWRIAVSDRYVVIAAPAEQVTQGVDGIVHVFSHTLTSGRPTHVASVHQDTPGITSAAEFEDYFGIGISVLPYRPSSSSPVGALVAVGSPGEDVGSVDRGGMAHLLHISPTGGVRELAAVHQNVPGVTSSAEVFDEFGNDTVLANLDPNTTVATPQTAVWAVSAPGEERYGEWGAGHVFPPGWRSGQADRLVMNGTHGMSVDALWGVGILRASATHLHVGDNSNDPHCPAVPWSNILNNTQEAPVVHRKDSCH